MSLLRKKNGPAATARARARSARATARMKASQAAPLAKSAGAAVRQGADEVAARARPRVRRARAWAAPRVDRTGKAVQEKVAPQVSDMLAKAARRLDPAPEPRRRSRRARRITLFTAAASALAVLGLLRKRVRLPGINGAATTAEEATSGASDQAGQPAADAAKVDVNGQVRTG